MKIDRRLENILSLLNGVEFLSSIILTIVRNLFWTPRIINKASNQGRQVLFFKNGKFSLGDSMPDLVIADLADSTLNPIKEIRNLKIHYQKIKVIGFYPHVRDDLIKEAKNAGCDLVIPKSLFAQKISEVLSGKI